MYELQMTEAQYYSYKNLAGVDNYIIESPTKGEDTEEKDLRTNAEEGWYDDEVDSNEVAALDEDTNQERIKEIFEPQDKFVKKENGNDIDTSKRALPPPPKSPPSKSHLLQNEFMNHKKSFIQQVPTPSSNITTAINDSNKSTPK